MPANKESSVNPYGEQGISTPFTVAELRREQEACHEVANLITGVVEKVYPNTIALPIGSNFRGTNIPNDSQDIDLIIQDIPFGPREPLPVENLGSTILEITSEEVLTYRDQAELFLPKNVSGLLQQGVHIDHEPGKITKVVEGMLTSLGEDAEFHRIKAWDNAAGGVITIRFRDTQGRAVNVDITLYNGKEFFGVEHTQRFNVYVEKLIAQDEPKALQLLTDIQTTKNLLRSEAKDDYGKKIPGYIIEALFTQNETPASFEEVINEISKINISVNSLPTQIPYQTEQLIKAGKPLVDLIPFITQGGYTALQVVTKAELKKREEK